MIPAVFDCMVFLQAATNPKGAAGACLAVVEAGQVQLFFSAAILAETQDVLMRPKIRKSFPMLTDEHVEEFIDHLLEKSTTVDPVPLVHRLPRDADDEPYLNLAITANAAYLVSRDKDLLDLMNDPGFLAQYPHLRIVDPFSFLTIVRSSATP